MLKKSFKINPPRDCHFILTAMRVTKTQHQIIKELAEKNKITMQEVVRQMIDFSIEFQDMAKVVFKREV